MSERKTRKSLNDNDVRQVVYMFATGVTTAKIANHFDICDGSVSNIISGGTRTKATGLEKDINNKYNLRNKTLLISLENGEYSKVFKPTIPSTKEPMISREALMPQQETTKRLIDIAKESINRAVTLDIKVTINGETAPTNALRKILMLIAD